MTKHEQRKEFQKLYLTGKYTQKELAQQVGVTEGTATQWVKSIPALRYIKARKYLAEELERVTKKRNYVADKDLISSLISDIERLNQQIIKAKYIPHLTD